MRVVFWPQRRMEIFSRTSHIIWEWFSRLNQREWPRGLLAIEQQFRLLSGAKWARKCIHAACMSIWTWCWPKLGLILNQYAHSRRASREKHIEWSESVKCANNDSKNVYYLITRCVLIQSERHNGSLYGLINIALPFAFLYANRPWRAHNKNDPVSGRRSGIFRRRINILLCALQVFQLFFIVGGINFVSNGAKIGKRPDVPRASENKIKKFLLRAERKLKPQLHWAIYEHLIIFNNRRRVFGKKVIKDHPTGKSISAAADDLRATRFAFLAHKLVPIMRTRRAPQKSHNPLFCDGWSRSVSQTPWPPLKNKSNARRPMHSIEKEEITPNATHVCLYSSRSKRETTQDNICHTKTR